MLQINSQCEKMCCFGEQLKESLITKTRTKSAKLLTAVEVEVLSPDKKSWHYNLNKLNRGGIT